VKTITIYTDGACSGNPGPGGWAALLLYNQHERILQGGEKQTTNNRMELQAAIEALRVLKEPCEVYLHTDSSYLVNAFQAGWLQNWVRKNWRKADNKPVENKYLWEELLILTQKHRVQFIKVKGHADDALNNRVDRLAVEAIPKL